MSYNEETKPLEVAQQQGYLLCQGSKTRRLRLQKLWRQECLRTGKPIVIVTKQYLYRPRQLRAMIWADLLGEWWLSRRLWASLLAEMKFGCIERFGNSIRVSDIPHRVTAQAAAAFVALLSIHRPTPEEAFDTPPALARGPARCLWTDGLEDQLCQSETYVLREIPNMLGHVVVFRPGKTPLVGVHLERFERVSEV